MHELMMSPASRTALRSVLILEKFVRANAFRHLCDNRQALLIA